jgi:hypothetical protein
MKIKAARRTLKKAYRNVDKEKMDQFLKGLRAPIWIRILGFVDPDISKKWVTKKVAQFKAAHEKKMKRAMKRGARQVAKTGSIG